MQIVGVVADSIYNDAREQTPDFIYLSRQQQRALNPSSGIFGVLDARAIGNAKNFGGPLSSLVRSFDSSASITYVKTLRSVIDESFHDDRLIASLCSIFSLLALVLTGVGLYGTLSFGVGGRTE